MKVRPGPDGLQAFLRQLALLVGRDVANVNFVFRCRCPDTGAEIFLQGLQAFEAAMHCACVAGGGGGGGGALRTRRALALTSPINIPETSPMAEDCSDSLLAAATATACIEAGLPASPPRPSLPPASRLSPRDSNGVMVAASPSRPSPCPRALQVRQRNSLRYSLQGQQLLEGQQLYGIHATSPQIASRDLLASAAARVPVASVPDAVHTCGAVTGPVPSDCPGDVDVATTATAAAQGTALAVMSAPLTAGSVQSAGASGGGIGGGSGSVGDGGAIDSVGGGGATDSGQDAVNLDCNGGGGSGKVAAVLVAFKALKNVFVRRLGRKTSGPK
ncbi:hypothetical protein VOLCADRAFT_90231 [Volvox carteri f. nagariensis]|uniref:Uncharacterized protein n=1 Tax=Volvox carteri f. nagariensis TaxID=3068 RepID=D8TTT9_VOLCA|nr:uncharacterized protein VOLCADRAFT_90231 [Volvox carteri f. nagariensis]EFJ48921.1 hypothetical protein VOLCADRAFT_90231 [Volvox carteri f. nagariensis]|eukprot:XP_002949818.1 hypothetical protein VOLCADRAFT_90231 [Volvox carteri f. nagariensis]